MWAVWSSVAVFVGVILSSLLRKKESPHLPMDTDQTRKEIKDQVLKIEQRNEELKSVEEEYSKKKVELDQTFDKEIQDILKDAEEKSADQIIRDIEKEIEKDV